MKYEDKVNLLPKHDPKTLRNNMRICILDDHTDL